MSGLARRAVRTVRKAGLLGTVRRVVSRLVCEVYSLYLTLRYVDERTSNRCFRFSGGAVLGSGVYPEHSLLAGVPARRVKGITGWKR